MSRGNEMYSREELRDKCNRVLEKIADTAAKMLAAKKRPDKPIGVNIVTLRKFGHGSDPRYEVVAYSSTTDQSRISDDRLAVEPRRLEQNAFFRSVLDAHGRQDYCIVDRVEDYLREAAKAGDRLEPHPYVAPRLYKSLLIVAIKGPKASTTTTFDLPDERIVRPLEGDETLFGFICGDSLEYGVFDTEWDLDVLRECATYAFEALDLWYRTFAAGNYSAVHLAHTRA